MNLDILNLIFNFLILLAGLYLIFWKSYFKEKGKNLATLEDIGEITSEVESVKESFNHNLENLKSELAKQNIAYQISLGRLLDIRYKRFDEFYSSLLDLQFYIKEHFFSYKDEEDYVNKKLEFQRLYKNTDIARYKIAPYISNELQQKLIDNLNKCFQAFEAFIKMYNSDTKKFGEIPAFNYTAEQLKSKMAEANIEAYIHLQESVNKFPELLNSLSEESKKDLQIN